VSSPLDLLDDAERELLAPGPPPRGSDAMKAVLTDDRFSDSGWIYERKLDGIRCIAVRDADGVRLYSRNDIAMNARYPEVADALEHSPGRFAVDGEVVAFDGDETSFAKLTRRGIESVPVFFYVFDVLWVDGQDVRPLPLRTRKRLLRDVLAFDDPLRATAHRNEHGEAFYEEACRKGWEGIIAKRADSPYAARRSRDWLKFKCVNSQEFVIGGFTDPKGSRRGFGALLLGYYRDGDLPYAGKVGTGFDDELLQRLRRRLDDLEQDDPPFTLGRLPRSGVHWVRPELVAQVGFTELTLDGRLRHPRFLGLRRDKDPREVRRERPE
jgi:bifunctional non-homologous end joining protein LigD